MDGQVRGGNRGAGGAAPLPATMISRAVGEEQNVPIGEGFDPLVRDAGGEGLTARRRRLANEAIQVASRAGPPPSSACRRSTPARTHLGDPRLIVQPADGYGTINDQGRPRDGHEHAQTG